MTRLTINHRVGDLFEQPAAAIVNPWNRNYFPPLMFRPGGVSGELLKRTGPQPWDELAQHGLLHLGEAVVTSAGDYPNARAIIHVAGLNMLWRASARSVQLSVRNAIQAAQDHHFESIVMPLIGGGHGHLSPKRALDIISETLAQIQLEPVSDPLSATVVRLPGVA